ncbi:MAG: hypothetical protein ACO1TE_20760 [Prosthecobacter sp.]
MGQLLSALIECIIRAFIADQKLADESLFGDTSERRSSRRAWQLGFVILLVIGLAILFVAGR